MYQKTKANGVFGYDPKLGDLKVERFRKEPSKDRFWQAALTIEGKIGNLDVTYAGAYLDRPKYTARTTIPITPTPMTGSIEDVRRARLLLLFPGRGRQSRSIRGSTSSAPITSRR